MFFLADSDAGQGDDHFDMHIGGSLASGKEDRQPVSIKITKTSKPQNFI